MEEKKNLELKSPKKGIVLVVGLALLAIFLVVLGALDSTKNKEVNNSPIVNNDNQGVSSQVNEFGETSVVDGALPPETEIINESPVLIDEVDGSVIKDEAPIEETKPITIDVTIDAEKGFNPASIEVKAGQQVTLNITANGGVAIVVFDGNLSASAVGINNGQMKSVTFNAPTIRGEYSFHNDVPGKNYVCGFIVK